jgi:hypothetical protein
MEFYGSIFNISGSVTASAFTGSYIGDGAGLYNLPASGVTGLNLSQISSGSAVASITPTGFTVNTNTTITGSLIVTGTVVSQTSTLVSGSSQIEITGTTGYSTFSSSLATTDLDQTNRLVSIENKTGSYATTGSNLFNGTQTHSGSILPSVDNTYDLGSANYQWRDVYISSGSLYIDGTKVISSTAQELIITTDNGQSIKILEGTTDSIILQTADGDIELKSSADGDILLDPTNGKIMLKGPVEILSGQKIQSSVGGTPVVFANDIVVSGSIDITGTIEGINLTDFSSSVNTRLSNLESAAGSLNSFTSSANSRLTAIETSTGSLNTFTSSINTTIKSKLDSDGVISGSSQIILTGTTGYSTFSSSVSTSIGDISGSVATTTSGLSSSIGSLSSSVATTTSGLTSTITSLSSSVSSSIESLSSSVATTTSGLGTSITNLSSSIATTTLNQSGRLDSIEGKTGSYATTGSNIFQGDQTITGSLYISQNLIVQGSSSLENITASAVSIGTNTIILNADTPAIRYAGISVFDSGSTNVTASLFYDSLTNNWKFKHSDVGTDDASILLYGPLGTGIDNAPTLVGNFLTKVEDNGHGHHLTTSSLFDDGSKISLKNNTEITGSVIITSTIVSQGTTLVSGSGQISYAGITNIPSGIISGSSQVISLLPAGTVSGSSQVLNGSGVWSGSAQLPSGIVSGSSQISFNGITDKPALVSGSSQISFGSITGVPSGLVSGSSQVLAGTTIHSGSFFNGISVVSGSAQISFNGITDKPTLVSGSSQISFDSITGVPGGLVSGSSQIDLTATTNYSSGIKTRLNAEGVLSGSAQVVAALPSGTVSGSAQITLSSTTGYGSVLNQAVLTTSTPTFAELTITSNQDGKLTLRVPSSGDTNDWNYINFVGANGTRDMYFGTDSVGNPTWYRDDNGVNISLGSVATVNGVQIVTNSGTWGISISGNAATVTGGVYTSGDQTISGTKTFSSTIVGSINGNSATVGGITPIQFFNNMGDNHSTRTSFDASTPSYGFGFRYVQGNTNGPATGGGGQFYSWYMGLGNDYPATGGGSYGMYVAIPRTATTPYMSVRYNESNSLGSWIKIAAGYADTAGNITAYTINQNLGTSNSVKFGSHCDLNISNSAFRFYDGSTFRGGLGLDDWAHSGSAANITLFAAGVLHFTSGGTKRAYFDTSGHLLPQVNNTYNLGSASLGWANVYTNDLHLSNMNKPEGNDIDGTSGNWTIQEGAENLYIINNNNGKKFKISLEEII